MKYDIDAPTVVKDDECALIVNRGGEMKFSLPRYKEGDEVDNCVIIMSTIATLLKKFDREFAELLARKSNEIIHEGRIRTMAKKAARADSGVPTEKKGETVEDE